MQPEHLPIYENCTYIPLSQGEWALVDTEYALVAPKFHLHKTRLLSYARHGKRVGPRCEGKQIFQFLHHAVFNYYKMFAPDQIDHINGNGLDNRLCNLRAATRSQNEGNKGLRKDNVSGYKGVCWHKKDKVYVAQITVNGKRQCICRSDDSAVCARAYDRAAIKYWDKFVFDNLNFPVTEYLTPEEIQEIMSK